MSFQLHWQDFSRWRPFQNLPKPPKIVAVFATKADALKEKHRLAKRLGKNFVGCVVPTPAPKVRETAASRRANFDTKGLPAAPKRLTP